MQDLLALSEQIGNVNTGLFEDDISSHLKIRRFKFNAPTINLEDLPCTDQNNESCTICLVNFYSVSTTYPFFLFGFFVI